MPARPESRPLIITSAGKSPAEEQRGRQVQYALIMSLRVACFIVAIAVPIGWVKVVAIAGALILPWIGVVGANAVRGRLLHTAPTTFVPEPRNSLMAPPER